VPEKRHSSYTYVKEIALSHKVVSMWNMDEAPSFVDMPMKRTIEMKTSICIPV
jgi:hypothetical protein